MYGFFEEYIYFDIYLFAYLHVLIVLEVIPSIKYFNYVLQIHNLLELVKKEQNIYNICFNEIIRQVNQYSVFTFSI